MRRIFVETIVCFVALSILLSLAFGHAILELMAGGTPGMFDIKHYFVPMSFVLDTALASGELPQWNPLTFCGAPFAANPQSATFYPPNVVRSLLTTTPSPLNTYYGLMILAALQAIGAGTGVYWLARNHRLGYVASFAAAATFITSIAYTVRLAEFHFVPALLWVPFTMLAVRRFLRTPERSRRMFWALGCGMLIGWSLLSGFIQVQVYVAVLLVSYALFDRILISRWTNYKADAPYAARIGADVFYGVCTVVIACAIASALLIPGAEFAQQTYRSGDGQASFLDKNLPWAEIREGMFGAANASSAPPFSASMLTAYFLGILGLLGSRRREAFVYVLLFLALFDCSIGPPLPLATLVEAMSPFQVAQPQRAFILCCLPLGIAVGFGVQFISERAQATSKRTLRSLAIVAICVGLVYLSELPLSNGVTILLATLSATAAMGIWFSVGRIAMPIACGLLLAEAVIINHRLLPDLFERSGSIDVASTSNESNAMWASNTRVADAAPNRHLYTLQPAINGYDPLYLGSVWQLLAPWYYNWNYKRILQAHDTVRDNPYPYSFVKRPFWLVQQYIEGELPEGAPLFSPTAAFVETSTTLSIPEISVESAIGEGVSAYQTVSLGRPEPVEVAPFGAGSQSLAWELNLPDREGEHSVLRLTFEADCEGSLRVLLHDLVSRDRLPVYIATVDDERVGELVVNIPLPDSGPSTIRLIWDTTSEDCAMEWSDATWFVDNGDENESIQIVERTFNTVRVKVDNLPAPRLLAFIDANYRGWTVEVDGDPAPLLNVNNAFKGVELEEGDHVVEFRFESAALKLGMAISSITTGIVLVGLIVALWRRRG